MFDRKVHIYDEKGKVLKEVRPYREHMTAGWPNMLVRNGKCYYDDGSPYDKVKAPEEFKKLYPDYFNVEETKVTPEATVEKEPVTEVAPVVKRRGRPRAVETPKEE